VPVVTGPGSETGGGGTQSRPGKARTGHPNYDEGNFRVGHPSAESYRERPVRPQVLGPQVLGFPRFSCPQVFQVSRFYPKMRSQCPFAFPRDPTSTTLHGIPISARPDDSCKPGRDVIYVPFRPRMEFWRATARRLPLLVAVSPTVCARACVQHGVDTPNGPLMGWNCTAIMIRKPQRQCRRGRCNVPLQESVRNATSRNPVIRPGGMGMG
jgi:hypothetical protein